MLFFFNGSKEWITEIEIVDQHRVAMVKVDAAKEVKDQHDKDRSSALERLDDLAVSNQWSTACELHSHLQRLVAETNRNDVVEILEKI